MPGSVSFSDLYGGKTPGGDAAKNQPQSVAAASGNLPVIGNQPAMFWIGLVACLVLVRFAWERGK